MTSPQREKSIVLHDPKPLLLSPDLSREEVSRLLAPYRLNDWEKADANLQLMAGDPRCRQVLSTLLHDLLYAVSQTADPDQALNEWERFLEAGNARTQVFSFLCQTPHILRLVCVLFGNSPAMAETLIRDPMLLYWLEDARVLKSRPNKKRLRMLLDENLSVVQTFERKLDVLRRFHRREMLRIGARDLFRVATVQETFQSLSWLAEIVIDATCHLIEERLQMKHGTPQHTDSQGKLQKTRFSVLGMGKLGGSELNYSSDVDLVYVYDSSHGETKAGKGQAGLSNEAYFQLLAQSLTQVLSEATAEGRLFRVDLRLRPEGTVGPLAWPIDVALRYYQTRGRAWERLAFLKARPIGGNVSVGRVFLRKIRPFVAGQNKDHEQSLLDAVKSLRTKIHQKVRRKGEHDRNVKLSPGGIRDIEFIIQTLQLLHVADEPQLFEPNTLKSLKVLNELQYVSLEQAKRLKRNYLYLRDLEHKLQMVHELQTHTLPVREAEIQKCAIRMGYKPQTLTVNPSPLLAEYHKITTEIQELVKKILF